MLFRSQRKNPTEPGIESPFRNRPIEESLDLFERMKNGEFEEGTMSLRAKIDMTSPNMNMRDPVMYRILKDHTTELAKNGKSILCTIGLMVNLII